MRDEPKERLRRRLSKWQRKFLTPWITAESGKMKKTDFIFLCLLFASSYTGVALVCRFLMCLVLASLSALAAFTRIRSSWLGASISHAKPWSQSFPSRFIFRSGFRAP